MFVKKTLFDFEVSLPSISAKKSLFDFEINLPCMFVKKLSLILK
jgi:hypothetical protein